MTRHDLSVRNPAQKDIALPPELFAAQAEKRVRLGMLLGELIKDNILAVSADKLKERATEIAASYENPADGHRLLPERSWPSQRTGSNDYGRKRSRLRFRKSQGN